MSSKTTDFPVFPIILDPFSGYRYKKTCSSDNNENKETNVGEIESKEKQVNIQKHPLGKFGAELIYISLVGYK